MKSARSKKKRSLKRQRPPAPSPSPPDNKVSESSVAIDQEIRDLRADLNRLDRRQIKSAQERQAAGQQLSKVDATLLRRLKDLSEELMFLEKSRRVPQRIYRLLSGRQAKELQEQATRHGLPFAGTSLDVVAIIRGFHDFLSRHRHRLATVDSDEMHMRSGESPTLERWRLAKAKIAEIELEEKLETIILIDSVRDSLITMAHVLRGVSEKLQRQFGQAAADVLNEGFEDLDRTYQVKYGPKSRAKQPETTAPHSDARPSYTPAVPICSRCGYGLENTPAVATRPN